MSLLSARSCCVALSGSPVIRDVSFEVTAGRFTALLGPNGSGKTTLLRAVAALQPYDGELALRGRALHAWSARDLARQVAFVRQAPVLNFDLAVQDLVALGRTPHKRPLERLTTDDRTLVARALELVQLHALRHRSVQSLSGGELQRAFLAQALAQEVDLLLLDEPTAHLDVHHQYTFLSKVHDLARDGRTILGAVHDLELAARYADHLIVLHADGRLAAAGPPARVLTADLIAHVFRMRASVHHATDDAPLRVRYHAPLPHETAAP